MTPFETGSGGSFSLPSSIGICHGSLTPATSVCGSHHITSSGWHQATPLHPLTLQGMDPLNTEQAAEIFQLATECQTLGSELAKWFQTRCRLEASHHMDAQATAHEIVFSRCQTHSASYGVAAATQQAEHWELTLHGLPKEAKKVWKDANDVIFSHLLKYDSELANFLNSAEDTLKNKCNEIWGHVQILVESMNCSFQTGLSLALQTLHWLLSIPWNLSYHAGIPTMFAYDPELYELQTWGATGDGGFHLDTHAQAANLLSHKLACINGRAGSGRANPSRVTSPASSVAPHSSTSLPARSRSSTPHYRTSLVRSCSHSASSTHFHAAAPESPAGSSGEGCEYSKSTSHDGDGTYDKSVAGSDDEAPGDDEHQADESSDSTNSSSNVEERSDGEVERSTSQAAKVPWNLMMRCQSMQPHHRKRQGKTQLQKKPRQVLLAPPNHPLMLIVRSLKQNGNVSDARTPGI